jgi:hypothetical protein
MTEMRLQEILWQKDVAAATCGKLIVSSLASKLTKSMVDALFDAAAAHRKLYFSQTVSLTVLRPNVAVPEPEARDRVKEVQQLPGAARASCVVIDGTGFWAAAMRGVLASFALVNSKAPVGAPSVRGGLEHLQKFTDGEDLVSLETDIVAFRVRHLGL